MRYAIVVEKVGEGFFAYVPDLPGCIATAATREAVEYEISEAIRFHVAGLGEDDRCLRESAAQVEASSLDRYGVGGDPFVTFTEWGGEADTAAYADL
jgi:predicted RNase H-like HicB family nuclease